MTDQYILAIDLGTSGPKVGLFSTRGTVLDGEAEPVRLSVLPHGGVEQDPHEWWSAVCAATRRLLARQPVAQDVIGVCVTAQWSGTVAVDAQGEPLLPAMIWMDDRGARYIRRVTSGFPAVQGYGASRLWTWIRHSGGIPTHSGKDSLAHILFLQHERPDVYQRTYKFLEPKDYLNLRLTGRFAATVESITLHWVTDNRNIHKVDYDADLLRMAGIDREKLPDLCRAIDVLGPLTPVAAEALGLGTHVSVVGGTPDIHSAAIGSGAVADFAPHCYIGTSGWLGCHVPFKKTDLFSNMASLPSALPGRYLLINEQETAGACLTWLRDQVLFPEDGLTTGPLPPDYFARLEAAGSSAAPGSNRLLFTPWLHGERSPAEDRTVRGGWHNLSLRTSRADMVRAVYEGIAFNTRWLMGAVEKFIGRPLDAISMVGGGGRSRLWGQIYADVLQRPILQVADPVYTNARGAGFLGAIGLGCLSVEDLGNQTPVAARFEPTPEHTAIYDELFAEFVELYRRNRDSYARLNRHA